jgi:hypothetical protein
MNDNPVRPTDTIPVSQASRCGAKTRSGAPCKSAPVTGRRRCRMHGGADGSGAPTGKQERQLQARSLHLGVRRHAPLAARGDANAPRPERARPIAMAAATEILTMGRSGVGRAGHQ